MRVGLFDTCVFSIVDETVSFEAEITGFGPDPAIHPITVTLAVNGLPHSGTQSLAASESINNFGKAIP